MTVVYNIEAKRPPLGLNIDTTWALTLCGYSNGAQLIWSWVNLRLGPLDHLPRAGTNPAQQLGQSRWRQHGRLIETLQQVR